MCSSYHSSAKANEFWAPRRSRRASNDQAIESALARSASARRSGRVFGDGPVSPGRVRRLTLEGAVRAIEVMRDGARAGGAAKGKANAPELRRQRSCCKALPAPPRSISPEQKGARLLRKALPTLR